MKQFRSILPYARPYLKWILAGMAFLLVSNAAGIIAPMLIKLAIDVLYRPDITHALIWGYAVLLVAATLVSGAARFGMRQLLNGVSRRIETDLRDDFFAHLMHLDASFYARQRTGDLMSRATNDLGAVRQAVGPGIMYLVNTIVLTAFALAAMLWISPRLTLISLIPMVFMPPAVLFFGNLIHARFERIQEHLGTLTTLVQENLSGARIVRAYRQEAAQEREFEDLNAGYMDRNMALARVSGVFNPVLSLLTGTGMVIVLWLGGRQVLAGQISVGDFVAFGIYLGILVWPMIALGWVINLFQRGAASMGRINEVLRTQAAVREPAWPKRPGELRGEIEFRDVAFRYPGSERDVLRGVSFRIPAGSTAALVGPTGSGKSTVVALLARLYDPTGGVILLDGVPLRELPLDVLRGALGVVPQDAFLFSETVRQNVSVGFGNGNGNGNDGAIMEAVEIAQMAEAVERFPHGLDTRLGERGINLSGGQRQRTTLARALVRDPLVLVLDDALSAVDTHTEAEILNRLRGVVRTRTALIVSHRVSAVMDADPILVLDDGRIVERGTHEALLARGGVYASLLRRQLIAEDLEEGEEGGGQLAASAADA